MEAIKVDLPHFRHRPTLRVPHGPRPVFLVAVACLCYNNTEGLPFEYQRNRRGRFGVLEINAPFQHPEGILYARKLAGWRVRVGHLS